MKKIFIGLVLVYAFVGIVGCGSVHTLANAKGQARSAIADYQNQDAAPVAKVAKRAIPATEASASSPVARSVAGIVHLMELGGLLCVVACGALIYFGLYIPAAKCGIAGIVLPVCAIWFNYHYGLVIGLVLICCAVSFIWGFYKKDTEDFELIESKLLAMEESIVAKVKSLFHPSILAPKPTAGK